MLPLLYLSPVQTVITPFTVKIPCVFFIAGFTGRIK